MQNNHLSQSQQITLGEKLLFYFVIGDILFFPYFFLIATTYSQLFVLIWFLLKPKCEFNKNEYLAFQIICFFVVIGTFISFLTIPNAYYSFGVSENIKRAIQFTAAITYYFFFYYIFKYFSFKIRKLLFYFLIYVTLWGILYFINFDLFLKMKEIFNHADSFLGLVEEGGYFYRFSFIWSDPNNIGYTIVALTIFLLINCRVSYIMGWGSISMLFFILVLVMSSGAWLAVILFLSIAFGIWFFHFFKKFSAFKKVIFIFFTVSFLFLGVHKFMQLEESEIGKAAIERIESNSGDSRFKHWKNTLSDKPLPLYLFVGEGYQTFVEGVPYSPHNGHLLLIFAYGAIAYILYMYIVFRKRKGVGLKYYLYLFPLFLCFSVNIGIGELKFTAILFLLVAYSARFNKTDGDILLLG